MSESTTTIEEIGKNVYGKWWGMIKIILAILLCGLGLLIWKLFHLNA